MKRYVNPALELLLNVCNIHEQKIYTCSFLIGQHFCSFFKLLFVCFVVSVEQWRTTPSVSEQGSGWSPRLLLSPTLAL